MIHGVGTDIVSIARMKEGIERFGVKFAERILHEQELAAYHAHKRPDSYLAKRFAAKESAVKALGTGFSQGISMRHVIVEHNDLGQPQILFINRAAELCAQLGVGDAQVSISDERDYAVAFVVLLKAAKSMDLS